MLLPRFARMTWAGAPARVRPDAGDARAGAGRTPAWGRACPEVPDDFDAGIRGTDVVYAGGARGATTDDEAEEAWLVEKYGSWIADDAGSPPQR